LPASARAAVQAVTATVTHGAAEAAGPRLAAERCTGRRIALTEVGRAGPARRALHAAVENATTAIANLSAVAATEWRARDRRSAQRAAPAAAPVDQQLGADTGTARQTRAPRARARRAGAGPAGTSDHAPRTPRSAAAGRADRGQAAQNAARQPLDVPTTVQHFASALPQPSPRTAQAHSGDGHR
jgi:hypothetical protein